MKDILLIIYHDGMPGIIAALITYDIIYLSGQDIDYLALAFVPPLRPNYYGIHNFTVPW